MSTIVRHIHLMCRAQVGNLEMDSKTEVLAKKREVRNTLMSLGAHVSRVGVHRTGDSWSVRAVISDDIPSHLKRQLEDDGIIIEVG